MSKTRNERKRDRFENFCFALVLLLLAFAMTMWLTLMACKAWVAEEPVSGYDHLATVQSWRDSDAVQN